MSNPLTTTITDDDKTLTSLDDGSSGAGPAPAEGAADVLGGGATAGVVAGPTRRRKMSRSNMLMLCTVALAAAAIGGMRYLAAGPRSSLAAPVKIDYDVETSKAHANDHKKVLAELATTQAAQVPPSQVQRNPFMMEGALQITPEGPKAPKGPAAPPPVDPKIKEAEERRRSIETAFSELDLHSVMGGPTPVARISGQTVRVGDVVGSYFKVIAIEGRTVTLQVEGDKDTFTLGMAQGPLSPGRPAPAAPKKPR